MAEIPLGADSIDAIQDRYGRVLSQFDVLIAYGKLLDGRFSGARVKSRSEINAVPIFIKLLCHAISQRALLPPRAAGGDGELWDVGSVCALARCVIDAYDALAYFCLDQVNDDERDFRELLSELHDQERRAKMLNFIGSTLPDAAAIRSNASTLRMRVQSHPFFGSIGKESQQKISRSDAPQYYLSQRQRNEAGGIDHRHYLGATVYLSQFVHTTPMAINQWRHFQAGGINEARIMMLSMQYALPYLAKGVHAMMEMFPSADEVPQAVADALDFWLIVAVDGVPGRGPEAK
jgi:hypothetical protein